MNGKQALIEWISKEDGGRTKPPAGVRSPSYSTEVRFVDGGTTWPTHEAWSLVVTKRRELGSQYRWVADIHFLFQNAPQESLREGRTFELHEGNRCVARGRVLSQEDADSFLTGATDMHVL